jgi:uncharacterized protein (TIGR00251 family)
MKILVKVKPNAKESRVKKLDDATFSVWVSEPAKEDKANRALIKTLADYFQTQPQNIKILIGRRSKQKIINIQNL